MEEQRLFLQDPQDVRQVLLAHYTNERDTALALDFLPNNVCYLLHRRNRSGRTTATVIAYQIQGQTLLFRAQHEDEQPAPVTCPPTFLAALSPTGSPEAFSWRCRCWEYWQQRQGRSLFDALGEAENREKRVVTVHEQQFYTFSWVGLRPRYYQPLESTLVVQHISHKNKEEVFQLTCQLDDLQYLTNLLRIQHVPLHLGWIATAGLCLN
jgi:hypothetical protein